MKKVLVVSNGFGEDYIAGNVVTALRELQPDLHITAAPLVGQGKVYETQQLAPAIKNPQFPSGGFIRSGKDLFFDVKAGLLGHILKQKRRVKALSEASDLSICVGDIFCLWVGRHQHKSIFLPTAKSDTFMSHSFVEKMLMKAHCTAIFTRDQLTADALKKDELPAQFLGNPMLDNLLSNSTELPLDNRHPIIGILPGSREEAYANLESIKPIILELQKERPDIQWVISIAPQINTDKIGHSLHGLNVHLSTNFNEVISRAWAIIGLAGTANEQAVAVGNTVFAFPGKGPQSSPLRFTEQEKLLGKNLQFINSTDPFYIAQSIKDYIASLKNPPKKKEPHSGSAATKIAHYVLEELSR